MRFDEQEARSIDQQLRGRPEDDSSSEVGRRPARSSEAVGLIADSSAQVKAFERSMGQERDN